MSLLSHCHGEKTKDVTEDTLETVVCQDIDISALALCHDGRQVELCRKATHFFANIQEIDVNNAKNTTLMPEELLKSPLTWLFTLCSNCTNLALGSQSLLPPGSHGKEHWPSNSLLNLRFPMTLDSLAVGQSPPAQLRFCKCEEVHFNI